MARQGRFGRLPRAAPSLTNTIVAIAREMENQRDQNIMSAWQKGGLFEGKPVTDERMLAYWKARLAGVDKADPLHDTYSEAISQMEYTIAESKMTARYALLTHPGAGDDRRMASFYLTWAKKVPRNSEFYRVLQRDAGQFLRAAYAKANSGSRASAEKAYNAQLDAIESKHEHAGQLALKIITLLAQRGSGGQGAVLGESPLGNERNISNTTNIAALELPSIDDIVALLGTVNTNVRTGGTTNGNTNVLFHDETGAPVTGVQIINMLKQADPTFNGRFDIPAFNKFIAQEKIGLQERIDLARKTGHTSDMMNLQMTMAKVNEYGQEVAAWPVMQSYADLKTELTRVINDTTLMPAAKVAAIDKIRTQIGNLADDPRIATDDHLQSQLRGEAAGTAGTVTVSEDMEGLKTGFTNGATTQNSEVAYVSTLHDTLQQQIDLTRTDPTMVMTQGDYVSDGLGGVKFQPSPGGHSIGAASLADVSNLPGAGPAITVLAPNGDGRGSTPLVLVPAAVTATARKADGAPIDLSNNNPVSTFVKYKVNGVDVTLYSMTDAATGQVRWTNDPPWDTSKIKSMETSAGITLDLSAIVPQADTTGPTGGAIGTGFAVIGKVPATNTKEGSAGQLVMDPGAATFGSQPERQAAGPDPFTDSFSPTLIALKSSPDGTQLLAQYAKDPAFAKILDDDAHRSAGMTYDQTTGQWAGNASQTSLYNQFHLTAQKDISSALSPSTSPAGVGDQWWRDTTQTQVIGAQQGNATATAFGGGNSIGGGGFGAALATDVLRNGGDQRFQSLYSAVVPGTNLVNTRTGGSIEGGSSGGAINTGITLKVPSVTPSAIAPSAVAPAPTSSVLPSSSSVIPSSSSIIPAGSTSYNPRTQGITNL